MRRPVPIALLCAALVALGGCGGGDGEGGDRAATDPAMTARTGPATPAPAERSTLALDEVRRGIVAIARNGSDEPFELRFQGPGGAQTRDVAPRGRARIVLDRLPGRYRAALFDPASGIEFQVGTLRVRSPGRARRLR